MEDGAKYVVRGTNTGNYFGYQSTSETTPIQANYASDMHPSNSTVCIYDNTTCTGVCGFYKRPKVNFLLMEYDSTGNEIYYRATGSESTAIINPRDNDGSYRDSVGTCTFLAHHTGAPSSATIYIPANVYTLPTGVTSIVTGLSFGLK